MTPAIEHVVSETEAWEIANKFASQARDLLGENLVAVVLVGSLATGGYVAGRSDVDLIVVATEPSDESALASISALAERYRHEYGFRKGFGGYAIRQSDLIPPYGSLTNEVFEILQLKRQGRVLMGALDLDAIPEPSPEDMRRSLEDSVGDLLGAWSRTYPPPIDQNDARANTILYWLRFLIWDRTGQYVLSKREVFAALDKLPEYNDLRMLLEPVRAYVALEQPLPDGMEELCRDVEAFMLQRVSWVAMAAGRKRAAEQTV
jgi:predicted nucleotidyltransferase